MEARHVNLIPRVKFSALCLFLQAVQNQTMSRSTGLVGAISFLIYGAAPVSRALCLPGEGELLPTMICFKKAQQNGF